MTRTVVMDMRPALKHPTGVGAVARGLARGLADADPQGRYILFSSSRKDRFSLNGLEGSNVELVDRRIPSKALAWGWNKLAMPRIEWLTGRCDIAHSMEPLPLPTSRARTIATVHDLFFLRHPELCSPEQTEHLRARIHQELPRADRVVTVSDHVRDQVLEEFKLPPERVVTVHNGLSPEKLSPATQEERQELRSRLRLPPGFILVVGTIEPRKNQGGLIRAFAELRKSKRHNGARVILCGRRNHLYHTQEKAVADCNITTEVRILDYLNDTEVRALVSLSRLVVVPSLDEGFSLPLIEAMAQGVPVAASRRGAIPEVAGDAALLFDPDDQEEMVEALALALSDEATRARLEQKGPERAAQFTWEAAARKMLTVYDGLQ